MIQEKQEIPGAEHSSENEKGHNGDVYAVLEKVMSGATTRKVCSCFRFRDDKYKAFWKLSG